MSVEFVHIFIFIFGRYFKQSFRTNFISFSFNVKMSMIGILYSLEQLHVMLACCLQITLQPNSSQSKIRHLQFKISISLSSFNVNLLLFYLLIDIKEATFQTFIIFFTIFLSEFMIGALKSAFAFCQLIITRFATCFAISFIKKILEFLLDCSLNRTPYQSMPLYVESSVSNNSFPVPMNSVMVLFFMFLVFTVNFLLNVAII